MPTRGDLEYVIQTRDADGDVLAPATTTPIGPKRGAKHPRMSPHSNSLHDDCRATDVSEWAGPSSADPVVHLFQNQASFAGLCPAFAFDADERMLTISFSKGKAHLMAFEPRNLDLIDVAPLPGRSVKVGDLLLHGLGGIFNDTSGGAYFFVDHAGSVVVPTVRDEIWVVGRDSAGGFGQTTILPVNAALSQRTHDDKLTACLPDWEPDAHGSDYYWFTTREGIVGLASRGQNKVVDTFDLRAQAPAINQAQEQIQNSFAVGPKGAFIVSSHAMYRFARNGEKIEKVWRSGYCRLDMGKGTGCPMNEDLNGKAPKKKPGQIDFGSGTTPTLLGDEWVVIGDAERTVQACVYSQETGELRGRIPLFAGRHSACENSFIGHGDVVLAGNTYGYIDPFDLFLRSLRAMRRKEHGYTRLEITPGDGNPKQGWDKPQLEVMSAPPKLSQQTGLVYAYTMQRKGLLQRTWSLDGIDFRTGEVVYRVPVFSGRQMAHDNAWGSMTIGPDKSLFICNWKGFLKIGD